MHQSLRTRTTRAAAALEKLTEFIVVRECSPLELRGGGEKRRQRAGGGGSKKVRWGLLLRED